MLRARPENRPDDGAGGRTDSGARSRRFNLSEWALEHRSMVLYLIVAIAILGALSYSGLGQSEDPPFTFKVMGVRS